MIYPRNPEGVGRQIDIPSSFFAYKFLLRDRLSRALVQLFFTR